MIFLLLFEKWANVELKKKYVQIIWNVVFVLV